jgi:uncharacterized protein YggE
MNTKSSQNKTLPILLFFLLLFLYSKFGPSLPISVISQQKGEPLVITEQGKVTAVPDMAKLTAGIDVSAPTLDVAQTQVNQKSKSLVDAVKKIGVEEKDIKTSSYNVYPEYDYRTPGSRITGYRISTTYEIKVKDIEKINEVLATVTREGANIVTSISFEVNEETKNKLLDEARAEAVKKARTKAESLAKAAGVNLGKILTISEAAENPPYPIALREGMGGVPDGQTTPEIQPGEEEVVVSVTISWEIR